MKFDSEWALLGQTFHTRFPLSFSFSRGIVIVGELRSRAQESRRNWGSSEHPSSERTAAVLSHSSYPTDSSDCYLTG